MKRFLLTASALILAIFAVVAQSPSEPALDKQRDIILGRSTLSPADAALLDKYPPGAPDGKIDVRDMALYINDKPLEASFVSDESIALASASDFLVSLAFSKPLDGTITIQLGGTASPGVDVVLITPTLNLNQASTAQVRLRAVMQTGFVGERTAVLTLKRPPDTAFNAGEFTTHTVRIRRADLAEFRGLLTWTDAGSMPPVPVSVGIFSNGNAPDTATFAWGTAGWLAGVTQGRAAYNAATGLLDFPSQLNLAIPGDALGRSGGTLSGSLTFTRRNPGEIEALTGTAGSQYFTAACVFSNLLGSERPLTINGTLTLTPLPGFGPQ